LEYTDLGRISAPPPGLAKVSNMDYQLLVVRGRSASEALKLADGVTTVGRHDDCQVRIKSSQVSRRHCEFFEKKGLLLVKDLGSANGTFVNGKKVAGQQVLEPGDELTIGGVTLRVAKVGQAPPPATTPSPVSAADTAVVEAIPVEGEAEAIVDDEEFEISFDDDQAQAVEDEVADILLSEPAPAAAAKPAEPPAKPAEPKAKEKEAPAPAAPGPGPAPAESADEAIADFLLDIKIDEDE
jgi:predicted component of type VI protein secretion system